MGLDGKLLWVLLMLLSAAALSRAVPHHPRWRPLVILLNLVVTIRYLWWRGAETLNWDGPVATAVSLAVYVAELYGFLVVLHHYLIATRCTKPQAAPPDERFCPTVDVFITTYNEGVDILYRTIVGCLALEYPRKTIHVLDDGRRIEIAALCRSLGVHYVTRADNTGAKAGNLNHGLTQSTGELVVTFDADHVPVRTFLKETVGHFRNTNVAQVQTPHHFYNPDLFQDRLRIGEYIANEQDMFYHIVQPGRDVYNSSFYCGSGAVFRRSALAAIGGFPTSTVTEDLHTSLLLHSRGYRSVYVNRDLSAGLAPESYDGYVTQRGRWARGTLQVMLRQRGLFLPNLTLMQRVNYLATLWYWLYGFPRVVYLVAPLLFLLGGIRPLAIQDPTDLLVYYLPHLAVSVAAFQLVNQGMRRIFWSDVYESCLAVQLALTAALFPFSSRRVRFAVTPKGRDAQAPISWRLAWPMVLLAALVATGVVVGTGTLLLGGGDRDATAINTFWAGYNLVVLGMGLLLLRARRQRRASIRLSRQLRCTVAWEGNSIEAETVDLSETGVRFTLSPPRALPDDIDLVIHGSDGRSVALRARLVRCDVDPLGSLVAAVRFVEPRDEERRKVVELMFCEPDAWSGQHGLTMTVPNHLKRIIRSMITVFARERVARRLAPRFVCDMRALLLRDDGRTLPARVVDISVRGAAIRMDEGRGPVSEHLKIILFWSREERTTLDARIRNTRTSDSGETFLGVEFTNVTAEQQRALAMRLYGERSAAAAAGRAVS